VVPFAARATALQTPAADPDGRPSHLRVLVVEDDEEDRALIARLLRDAPECCFEAVAAPNVEAALRQLAGGGFDLALVDYRLPGRSGLDLLRIARRRGFELPVVLISAQAEAGTDDAAIEAGAADYLDKDELDSGRLDRTLRFALARHRAQRRLDRLAQYDELTGIANATLFADRLNHGLASARRHGTCCAVMVLDLDGFKAVNDRLGHAAGDHFLCLVADRLSQRLRETDTVARLGGDQFAILLENLKRPEHAALVARKILDCLAAPATVEDRSVEVGASLGAAISPADSEDPATLLRQAEAAMGRVKAEGGHGCHFHNDDLAPRLVRGALVEADLRRALEAGELVLHFKPQVTLRSPMVALAALPRWRHPELGTVDLERFRGLAEDSGLLEPLNAWLIESACRHLRDWSGRGPARLHVGVPVLSRRQLAWSDLAERTLAVLERYEVPPQRLELEIEEALALEDFGTGGGVLRSLADAGIRIALTGFGTGTASLTLLRDTPISTLKLSRALLHGTPEDRHRSLFADAVIQLARYLGIRLVAEGVDSISQLKMLKRAGCDAAEAVLDSPPLPAETCTEWLREAARRGG